MADDLESFYCASGDDDLVMALIAYERSLTNFNDDELVNETVTFDNGQTSGYCNFFLFIVLIFITFMIFLQELKTKCLSNT